MHLFSLVFRIFHLNRVCELCDLRIGIKVWRDLPRYVKMESLKIEIENFARYDCGFCKIRLKIICTREIFKNPCPR